ncbi:MAG: pyridoxal 5'-phosphate synthase glutaminase subunit PdxT [SAR324 cluster bacterium]|nr:pyridoxal 5'-phosphate synthase glutaminase subunit PdxT [SAR324 cluster bacterium]
MRIGVFALQGAVEPHLHKLRNLGAEGFTVRTAEELATCAGLIIPGGESTTFLRLIGVYGLRQPLQDFAAAKPVWGICAGSILMAREVENPPQESLGIMPIRVRRNAYGRQNESFIGEVTLNLPGRAPITQESVFIRAPQIVAWDDGARILAEHDGKPVAMRHGRHLTTTFHPELSEPEHLHQYFLNICDGADSRASA